jgi:hypothetical protein
MLSPEMFIATGVVLVIVSLALLAAAGAAREWFFQPELRTQLQPALIKRNKRIMQ